MSVSHLDAAGVKIEATDPEPGDLSRSQTGVGGEPDEERVLRRLHRVGEPFDLFGREELRFGSLRARQLHSAGRVLAQRLGIDGFLEHEDHHQKASSKSS